MATEQEYDEIIAPMLLAVAKECERLGMSLIARVEWEPGESGITQIGLDHAGIGQKLTQYAAHAHGNVDSLFIGLRRDFDPGNSMVLHMMDRDRE